MLPLPFDNPTTYPGHSGVDFPQAQGTVIQASGPGRVVYRGWLNQNAGYSVQIAYDGLPTILYCHLPNLDAVPAIGTRVHDGTPIGHVGATGRSTGPHLHLEVMTGKGAHTHDGIWLYFQHRNDPAQTIPAVPTPQEESTMALGRILVAQKGNKNGKTFLALPNPRAYADPKQKPYIAIVETAATKGVDWEIDARNQFTYNYIVRYFEGVNQG